MGTCMETLSFVRGESMSTLVLTMECSTASGKNVPVPGYNRFEDPPPRA